MFPLLTNSTSAVCSTPATSHLAIEYGRRTVNSRMAHFEGYAQFALRWPGFVGDLLDLGTHLRTRSSIGLVPYFDVLTHVNDQPLVRVRFHVVCSPTCCTQGREEDTLVSAVKDGVSLKMVRIDSLLCAYFVCLQAILNIITRKPREIVVIPRSNWGGEGLLGAGSALYCR